MGTVRGYRRGTWLLWARRSTAGAAESASGAQRPQRQRADGECAELALRAHQAYRTVRAPFLPPALTSATEEGRLSRLCSERAACQGMHCMSGASSGGGAAAELVAVLSEGTLARDVSKEYSRRTASYGYGARVPQGAHGCCGGGVVRPSPLRVCSARQQGRCGSLRADPCTRCD
jgi:hypothetical protein